LKFQTSLISHVYHEGEVEYPCILYDIFFDVEKKVT